MLAPLLMLYSACQLLALSRTVGGPYKTTQNIDRFADPFDRVELFDSSTGLVIVGLKSLVKRVLGI